VQGQRGPLQRRARAAQGRQGGCRLGGLRIFMKRKIRDEAERKWNARKLRSTNSVSRSARARVTVFRSARHIYAQLIDSVSGRTLGSVSSRSKSVVGDGKTGNVDAA